MPVRKRWRRKTGWDLRSATRCWVNPSRPVSVADQSTQETSLSWQYALLLPSWGPAQLIAAEQQRDAGRQQQGGEHGPGPLRAQRRHVRVDRRALGAAVPGAVVVGAVPVGLPLCPVVLAVVAHQVHEREAVVHGDQVHRGVGPRRSPPLESPPNRSAEPANRVANSPRPIFWLRQNPRMLSRYLPSPPRHRAGNRPRS